MDRKMYAVVLAALMVVAILGAGCSGGYYTPVPQPTPRPQPELHGKWSCEGQWSVGLGCYYQCSGYVYNSGNGAASNAVLNFNILDSSNVIVDSKLINIGYLAPGASKDFSVVMDVDCGKTYHTEGRLSSSG